MKKQNSAIGWAIGLSTLSIIAVIALALMWIFQIWEFTVVSLDTFVGVVVALLAIIVTFAIGWQILNAMDIRSNIKAIEEKMKHLNAIEVKIEKQRKQIDILSTATKHLLNLTWAEYAQGESDFEKAFYYCVLSLRFSLELPKSKNVAKLLQIMTVAAKKISIGYEIDKKTRDILEETDKEIRKQHCFEIIKDSYEKSYKLFFKKVKVTDGE